jgi:hypothetical protein
MAQGTIILQGYYYHTSDSKYHRLTNLDITIQPVTGLTMDDGMEWRILYSGTRHNPRAYARNRQHTHMKFHTTLPETMRRELDARLKARAKFKVSMPEWPIMNWINPSNPTADSDDTAFTTGFDTVWMAPETAPVYNLTFKRKGEAPYLNEFLWEIDVELTRVTSEDTTETP